MLDLRQIRQDPSHFDEGFKHRGLSVHSKDILDLDETHRALLTQLQDKQTLRNALAKQIGEAKKSGGDAPDLMKQADQVKQEMAELDGRVEHLKQQLDNLLSSLPNIPAKDVPIGPDEASNEVIRTVGNIPNFSFSPKEHYELGEALGMMDFERSAKMSGARFVVLYGPLARLERALGLFMLDVHTQEFGYREVQPPLMVKEKALFGTGQLPKMREDLFVTSTDHWLIPTSEVVLTNLVADEIISEKELPMRFTAYTPCFRSEAGAAGKDTRGMIRQHQFHKVELVSITTPDKSVEEHERMTNAAESILQKLSLPYRVVALSTGDMGFQSNKTYDLDVWLPGQNTYREISSCSNCGDFQARRMNARFRPLPTESDSKPSPQFVHTLNGSGLAVGRTLVAVMENYQESDGSIRIPDVLKPYMGNITKINRT